MLRPTVIIVAAILVGWSALVLTPPFPAPTIVMKKSFRELATELGPPHEITKRVAATLPPTKSWVWARSRLIAYWTLEVIWPQAPVGDSSRPHSAFRCLRFKRVPEWVGIVSFFPCEGVVEATIMASNYRWSGP